MPAWVGNVNVATSSGNINFGDVFNLSPKSVAKAYTGSGAGNTGNFVITNNAINNNLVADVDAADQDIIASA